MHRPLIATGETPRSADFLFASRAAYVGLAKLAAAVLGTSTIVNGLPCTPGTGLAVSIGPGEIYSLLALDTAAYGTLPADAHNVLKQGVLGDPAALGTPAPTTPGQSVVYLIEAQLQETDGGAQNVPFYNSANPTVPNYAGINTIRFDKLALQVKAGAPATTGQQVAPSVDAGWTPLYTVTVGYGATFITQSNIAVAQGAPFLTLTLPGVPGAIAAAAAGQTPQTPNGFGTLTPLASASTTDLGSCPTKNVLVTGTATINNLGTSANLASPIYLTRFQGALTINASSTILLPSGANITTAAGDVALWEFESASGAGQWRLEGYFPAVGVDPAGSAAAALSAANQNLAATAAGLVPRAGNVLMTGPLGVSAPSQFDRSSAAVSSAWVAVGGAPFKAVNGVSSSQTLTPAMHAGALNVVFGATAATLFAANSIPAGTRIAFTITGSGQTVAAGGSDQLQFGDGGVTTYAPSVGTTVELASDGVSNWWCVREANLVAPAFRKSFTAPGATIGNFTLGSNIIGPNSAFAFTLAPASDAQSGQLVLWGSASSGAGNALLGNDVHNVTVSRGGGVAVTQLNVSGLTKLQAATATSFSASAAVSGATGSFGGIVIDGNIHGGVGSAFTVGGSPDARSGRVVVWDIGSAGAGQAVLGNDQHNITVTRGARPQVDSKDIIDAGGGQTIGGVGLTATSLISTGAVTAAPSQGLVLGTTTVLNADGSGNVGLIAASGAGIAFRSGGATVAEIDSDLFMRLDTALPRTANDSRAARTDFVQQQGWRTNGQVNATGAGTDAGSKIHVSANFTVALNAAVVASAGSGAVLTYGNTSSSAIVGTFQGGNYLYGITGPNGSFTLGPYEAISFTPDGGNAYFVISAYRNGNRLQTLAGYPINIASGSNSYDLTWTPQAYDRLVLSIGSYNVANGQLTVSAFRDGNGNWNANSLTLGSTGAGGPTGILVEGADINSPLILAAGTGAGTGFPALTNGMSGIRLASTVASSSFSANNVLLSGA